MALNGRTEAVTLGIENEILQVLRRLSRASELHSRDLLNHVGLTTPQLSALKAIFRLQPVAVTTVARELHLALPTMTGILQRLERRGLIARVRDEVDRRSLRVTLSAAGEDALRAAPSLLQSRFREELSKLADWEQSMMLATLQRIASMLADTGNTSVPRDAGQAIQRKE